MIDFGGNENTCTEDLWRIRTAYDGGFTVERRSRSILGKMLYGFHWFSGRHYHSLDEALNYVHVQIYHAYQEEDIKTLKKAFKPKQVWRLP